MRHHLLWLASLAAMGCGSFGAAEVSSAPIPAADAGRDATTDAPPDAAPACVRPSVVDGFEGTAFDAAWRGPKFDDADGGGSAHDVFLATDRKLGGAQSLKSVLAASSANRIAYLERDVLGGACPLTLSFAYYPSRGAATAEALAYARIETTEGWFALRQVGDKHVLLEQRRDPPAGEGFDLPDLPSGTFTRISIRYDPTTSPPSTTVSVGDANTVVKHILLRTAAIKLSLGVPFANGGAAFEAWFDDLEMR